MCILILPKCNASFTDEIFTIYRPEKSEMVQTIQTIQTELSMNSNTTWSERSINAYVTWHLRGMFYDSKTQLIQYTDWQSDWKRFESSKSLLLRFPSPGKKISPVKFSIPPNPLPLFGKPQYIKLNGPFLWKGWNCLKAIQSHYEETVSPEIPGTH